ncbi:hypothetical protein SAMN05216490_4363 [Mucilaginibacter mallensis]|uniref:Uncharacterized protein n=1 Tax=Mucilaginibacter mallensis TaxID=652787 RepID=A0A1H2BU11_MUCMA|nr:hypothetical protein SAMN05216490_4363 [Mucilaginibacter mallensis]
MPKLVPLSYMIDFQLNKDIRFYETVRFRTLNVCKRTVMALTVNEMLNRLLVELLSYKLGIQHNQSIPYLCLNPG